MIIYPINNLYYNNSIKLSFNNSANFKSTDNSVANVNANKNTCGSTVANIDAKEFDKTRSAINRLYVLAFIGIGLASAALCIRRKPRLSSVDSDIGEVHSQGFKSLKDDLEIPVLENCKSLNKSLKNALENQIEYIKSGKTILEEAGSPNISSKFLLAGPPGTGKSFFAKILAKTLGADYMELKFSDFSHIRIGQHEENLKAEFENVRNIAKESPDKKFVLTINEIDAIIQPVEKITQSNLIYKPEERSIFINYIDLISKECPNVIIVGTTNTPVKNLYLDGAALSRFKNIIDVPYPDKECLYEALKAKIINVKDGKTYVADNDNFLKEIAKTMEQRAFSFRDLDYAVDNSKMYFLKDKNRGYDGPFKTEYLKNAINDITHTDGEISQNK